MNPKGMRGKSITPKMRQDIERDLDKPNANRKEIAQKYGISVNSVGRLDRARRLPPIDVKGVKK